jgi:hypothetical protein
LPISLYTAKYREYISGSVKITNTTSKKKPTKEKNDTTNKPISIKGCVETSMILMLLCQ